jgi:hypothetical protein
MSASPEPLDRALVAEILAQAAGHEPKLNLKELGELAGVNYRSVLRYLTIDASDWREMDLRTMEKFARAVGLEDFGALYARAKQRLK